MKLLLGAHWLSHTNKFKYRHYSQQVKLDPQDPYIRH